MTEKGQRRFRTQAQFPHAGDGLPDDDLAAFAAALPPGFALSRSTADWRTAMIAAEITAPTPLDALTTLNRAIDQALLQTGLFDQFDVTGKSLHVEPAHPWHL